MKKILEKLYNTNDANRDELINILNHYDREYREALFCYARKTRLAHYGNKVFLRGLIEFSNVCRNQCLYCGLRAANRTIGRYRMTEDEILGACDIGYKNGFHSFVLQSGEDETYTKRILVGIIEKIKGRFPDSALTLSIGERDFDTYQALFQAGVDRFLLRHETASKDLYQKLHPGMDFNRRMECLHALKDIGYQVGAGFMVGLPGQTADHLVDDLLFLKPFQPHMIGIGPFIPHNETPLKGEKAGTVENTAVLIALTRLLVPTALLPATTAMGTLHSYGRELALMAGANVMMPNLTPYQYQDKYQLYQKKTIQNDEPVQYLESIKQRIHSVGMEVDMGRGDHLCRNHNII